MNIKKIFINCMLILCIGVIVLSVVTVVKRGNEPADDVVVSQDMEENETIVFDTETVESTEEAIEEETVATKTLYTVSKVNVRRGPGTNYEKVVELKARVAVVAIGDLDENGWQKIEYEGEEAYILGRYLTEIVPEAQSQSVGNQTTVAPQAQNVLQQTEVVQTPPAESEPVWYFPVGNVVEQVQTTPVEPESAPEVPESTPVESESTPTVVPETTPIVPETTPTTPEVTPTTPEVTPVTPEQTPVIPSE